MKKTITCMMMAIATIIGFTSCDEEKEVVFATWKGFTVNPTEVSIGDSVVVKAEVDKPGNCLYNTSYTWTMEIDTINAETNKTGKQQLEYRISSTPQRPIHMNDQPVAYFKIPANAVKGSANRRFTFQVNYDNAVYATPVTHKTEIQEGYLGDNAITYSVLTGLYSKANATFKCNITIK